MSNYEEFLVWVRSLDPVDVLLMASVGSAVIATIIALLS